MFLKNDGVFLNGGRSILLSGDMTCMGRCSWIPGTLFWSHENPSYGSGLIFFTFLLGGALISKAFGYAPGSASTTASCRVKQRVLIVHTIVGNILPLLRVRQLWVRKIIFQYSFLGLAMVGLV